MGHGYVSKTEGWLLVGKAVASHPVAQHDPVTQRTLSSLTAQKGSSILRTQRQPRGHLTGVPRHDPEETQDSDAVQCRAGALWHAGSPDGWHILLPRKAFQSTVHSS